MNRSRKDDVVRALGSVLSDRTIARECEQGTLIRAGYDERQVSGASYELRASAEYHDLSGSRLREDASASGFILVKPLQHVVIMTIEDFSLPADMVAQIVSKGSMFSIGLLPICTWADPGFRGRLGLVVYNASANYVSVPVGAPIAKVMFLRLDAACATPYEGQHGYGTGIWPVPSERILDRSALVGDPRVGDLPDEIAQAMGPLAGEAVRRVLRYERYFVGSIITYAVFTLLLLVVTRDDRLETMWALALGVISNVAFSALTIASTRAGRRRSR